MKFIDIDGRIIQFGWRDLGKMVIATVYLTVMVLIGCSLAVLFAPTNVFGAELSCSQLYNTSTLKAYWNFNGNGNDLKNSHNWSLNNASYVSSDYGQALDFNGSSTYGTLGDNSDMAGGSGVSIYFKVKLASDRPQYGRIFNQWLGGSNYSFTLYNDNNDFEIYQSSDGAGSGIAGWGPVSGAWTNYTNYDEFFYVLSGTTGYLYKNGQFVSSAGITTMFDATTDFYLGASQDGGLNGYFKGQIDEMAYFSGVVSAGEVTEAFNAGLCGGGGTITSTPIVLSSGGIDYFIDTYFNMIVLVAISGYMLAFSYILYKVGVGVLRSRKYHGL